LTVVQAKAAEDAMLHHAAVDALNEKLKKIEEITATRNKDGENSQAQQNNKLQDVENVLQASRTQLATLEKISRELANIKIPNSHEREHEHAAAPSVDLSGVTSSLKMIQTGVPAIQKGVEAKLSELQKFVGSSLKSSIDEVKASIESSIKKIPAPTPVIATVAAPAPAPANPIDNKKIDSVLEKIEQIKGIIAHPEKPSSELEKKTDAILAQLSQLSQEVSTILKQQTIGEEKKMEELKATI